MAKFYEGDTVKVLAPQSGFYGLTGTVTEVYRAGNTPYPIKVKLNDWHTPVFFGLEEVMHHETEIETGRTVRSVQSMASEIRR